MEAGALLHYGRHEGADEGVAPMIRKAAFSAVAGPLLAIAFAALAVPACAGDSAPEAPAKQNVCLQRHRIDGWASRDAHTLVVSDIFRKKFLLTVNGWCQDLDFSMGLSFHTPGGGDYTCLDRGDYVVPHGGGVMPARGARCYITKIEAYTPQMEAAYREAKDREKAEKGSVRAGASGAD